MKSLQLLASLFLVVMLIAAVVHWNSHPVRRARINPASLEYRIPVNRADAHTLSLLSGISARLGQQIIDHRQQHGPFRNTEDLDAVPRLGPITLEKISPWLSFDE